MLWQSSIHLLKDKNAEWSNFLFFIIDMCNIIIIYTAEVGLKEICVMDYVIVIQYYIIFIVRKLTFRIKQL